MLKALGSIPTIKQNNKKLHEILYHSHFPGAETDWERYHDGQTVLLDNTNPSLLTLNPGHISLTVSWHLLTAFSSRGNKLFCFFLPLKPGFCFHQSYEIRLSSDKELSFYENTLPRECLPEASGNCLPGWCWSRRSGHPLPGQILSCSFPTLCQAERSWYLNTNIQKTWWALHSLLVTICKSSGPLKVLCINILISHASCEIWICSELSSMASFISYHLLLNEHVFCLFCLNQGLTV